MFDEVGVFFLFSRKKKCFFVVDIYISNKQKKPDILI